MLLFSTSSRGSIVQIINLVVSQDQLSKVELTPDESRSEIERVAEKLTRSRPIDPGNVKPFSKSTKEEINDRWVDIGKREIARLRRWLRLGKG